MLSGLENPIHLLLLFGIILLLFGAKRLPEMGRSLGSGMREFKAGILGDTHADNDALPQLPAPIPERSAVTNQDA